MSFRTPVGARGAAHVFVEDLDRPSLTDEDAHHLARSLRLRDGEKVTASDGHGLWRECRFRAGRPPERSAGLEPDGDVVSDPLVPPRVGVGFAVTKGGGPERIVRRLTEIGVDEIVPLSTARSVPRWEPGRAARNAERLARVARDAAMQSRRTRLPTVSAVTSFEDLARSDEVAGRGALAHRDGDPPSLHRPFLMTGPEGGWSADELGCGLPTVGLGPTQLRADTAALFAGMVLCALRWRVVAPAGGIGR